MMLWPRMAISPTSPCGTSLPSLVDDLHLDALDRRADRARLALPVGMVEAGDRRGLRQPVALEDLAPKASSNPRMTSTGSAAPPDTQRRRQETSKRSRSGWLSRAWYIVGTPSKIVTWSRWMISSALPASKRGIMVRQRADLHRRVEPAGLAEGVEQRQRAEHDVALRAVEQRAARTPRSSCTGCRASARRPSGCRSCPTCRGSRRCRSRRARPISVSGSAAPTSCLELARLDDRRARRRPSSAPSRAASSKPCQANSSLRPGSER